MIPIDHRPCERQCDKCRLWKHHSRFHCYRKISNGTVAKFYFREWCRDCEQKERNERKNADRPLAIIRGRAQEAARKAGASTEFFMVQMNYRALVPWMRAMMTDEGLCINCGHPFVNERDIQIDHLFPPRHRQDWALLHGQNLRLGCGACNNKKGSKQPLQWMDEQEGARLSNLDDSERPVDDIDPDPQLDFGF